MYKVNDELKEYIISPYRAETLQPKNWKGCKVRILYEYKDMDEIIEILSEYNQVPQTIIDDMRENLRKTNKRNRKRNRNKRR